MARLHTSGAEVSGLSFTPVEPSGAAGVPTRDTSKFRTGAASWKCAGNAVVINPQTTAVGSLYTASQTSFARAYLNFDAAPGSVAVVMGCASNSPTGPTNGVSVKLTSAGKLQLFDEVADTQIGSDSTATLVMNGTTWYRIEVNCVTNATPNITTVELRLDGVTVASSSGLSIAASGEWYVGLLSGGAGVNAYIDDLAFNDSTGAANNTWPGAGGSVFMFPISDNARGNWTDGAGGTTNLFDAVNNAPPVGVADASATNGSQIKIKSTTLPSNCDLNLATYTAAGVTGTVNACLLWVNDGEDPSTGTKAGTAAIASNPSSGTVSFNFGDDVGAQGTYVGNWKWHFKLAEAPSVTLGTAPVIRITCTSGSTGTRAASCDFMGVYVDFTPPAAAAGSLMLPNRTRITRKR